MNDKAIFAAVVVTATVVILWGLPKIAMGLVAHRRAMTLFDKLGDERIDKEVRKSLIKDELQLGVIGWKLLHRVSRVRGFEIEKPIADVRLAIVAYEQPAPTPGGPRTTIGSPGPQTPQQAPQSVTPPPPVGLVIEESEDIYA